MMPALADLVAAPGVMGTLMFLALEVRRNSRDMRHAKWRALLESYSAFKGLTNDREFAEFIVRARQEYEGLSDAEKLSFGHYQEQGIHVMSNFFKHEGLMPEELAGLEQAVKSCLIEHQEAPGSRAFYADNKARGQLMPGTYARLDRILAETDRQ